MSTAARLRRRALAAAAAVLAALSGCVMDGVSIVVSNHSSSELHDVMVTGRGFASSIGDLRAGGSETVTVHPKGESSIKVAFEANGERHSQESGYVEDDVLYTAQVTIEADLTITIETNLR